MPVGLHPPDAEYFGNPEMQRNFKSSLRQHGGRNVRAPSSHRDYPWTRYAGHQCAADWKASSKNFVNGAFASSLREYPWEDPDAAADDSPPKRHTKYAGARSGSAPPARPKGPGRAATDRAYQQAMAGAGFVLRRSNQTAADWRCASKYHCDAQFGVSLRDWSDRADVRDVGWPPSPPKFVPSSDEQRWPNSTAHYSGGWRKVTTANADRALKHTLRNPKESGYAGGRRPPSARRRRGAESPPPGSPGRPSEPPQALRGLYDDEEVRLARAWFADADVDMSGRVTAEELKAFLRAKLLEANSEINIRQVLSNIDVAVRDELCSDVDFDGWLELMFGKRGESTSFSGRW